MDRCKVLFDLGRHWNWFFNSFTVSTTMLSQTVPMLQLAFTMVWMTIISQLGYYKILYGPQVLLQMNIAYFLPSIPLLGLSSQFDERLDQKFGMLVFQCWEP